jgi:hypothetical protein
LATQKNCQNVELINPRWKVIRWIV